MNDVMDRWIEGNRKYDVFLGLEIIAQAYIDTSAESAPRLYVSRVVHYVLSHRPIVAEPRIWPTDDIQKLMLQYPELNLAVLHLTRTHTHDRAEDPRSLPRLFFLHSSE